MIGRRDWLKQAGVLSAYGLGCLGSIGVAADVAIEWRMPDEGDTHRRTWMAFGAQKSIWGAKLLTGVQQALARVANAIVQHEPVSMLVRQADLSLAKSLCDPRVQLVVAELDDLWVRDTGAVFVKNAQGKRAGIGFNFNGWGNKQAHSRDAKVAALMAKQAEVEYIRSELVLEGGALEVDGHGTAIITQSCVLNNNRNPGVTKADCEAELRALLGIEKVIWLPGIANHDITDGHTDFYARFASPGLVVAALEPDPTQFDYKVTREHLKILQSATDAKGRKLQVVTIEGPSTVRPQFENDDFAAGYINFYLCNGAVIVPEFGDAKADGAAQQTIRRLFPNRKVVAVNIDAIAAGGGGIHCATQQEVA